MLVQSLPVICVQNLESVQGRLKSMYSIYKKMIRKKIPVRQVYDARALRVIVGDEGGSKTEDAWAAAYRFVTCLAETYNHMF